MATATLTISKLLLSYGESSTESRDGKTKKEIGLLTRNGYVIWSETSLKDYTQRNNPRTQDRD